jgi:hypothetical protein
MSPTELPTILVTEEHFVSARVPTRDQRLLDVLNDSNTDFLRVRDAQLFRRGSGASVTALPNAVIRKANIGLAIPASDEHEAPQKRYRNFVSKKEHGAFLIVFGYEVRGQLFLRGTDDPVVGLCHELGNFFAVPHGAVSFAGSECDRQESQVVLVNKDHVSVLQIGQQAAQDANLSEGIAGLVDQPTGCDKA